MDVASTTVDHITEVLTRVIEFTRHRRDLLTRNIFECRKTGFVPMDLPSVEFANCMTRAVSEHLLRNRLVYVDTDHLHFESGGHLQTLEVVDKKAVDLLNQNQKEYLKYQLKKLSENTLNNRIAVELLRIKQQKPKAIREK